VVNGYKLERQNPWRHIAIGQTYNGFARFLSGFAFGISTATSGSSAASNS